MKTLKIVGRFCRKASKSILFIWIMAAGLTLIAWAEEKIPAPETYMLSASEVPKIKKMLDDPKDLVVTYPLKDALPPEVYRCLTFDIEEAKSLMEELVGFKSPDLVGKIAPEVKPGEYTYQDLEKIPGLKDLFPPELLLHIKPGGPPLVGNIPEFEIIPTRQIYWYANYCRATKDNLGKTKLDKDGYLIPKSWQGGCPFPRPSGKFKAQQVHYAFEKKIDSFDRCVTMNGESMGFNKKLEMDQYNKYQANLIKFMGRTIFPPYGWLDERAERNGEFMGYATLVYEPRASRGTVVLRYAYDDPDKLDPTMIYVPSLRRIRKMATTDTQDPKGDNTYDDSSHLSQKITPRKYPYKFDIIAEREYLIPISWNNAAVWIDSKNGYCLRDIQFMRRPCYVLQMTQLDPNYVYSKRIIYIDKENFSCVFSANYDQRGRLYRSQNYLLTFLPEVGQISMWGTPTMQFDYIDEHSTFQMNLQFPASFSRQNFTMQYMIKKGK